MKLSFEKKYPFVYAALISCLFFFFLNHFIFILEYKIVFLGIMFLLLIDRYLILKLKIFLYHLDTRVARQLKDIGKYEFVLKYADDLVGLNLLSFLSCCSIIVLDLNYIYSRYLFVIFVFVISSYFICCYRLSTITKKIIFSVK